MPHNTVDGVNYGVPHGRGPNLLGYNTDRRHDRADQLGSRLGRRRRRTQGKISVYDSSIYIADAALHLMTKQPDLGHQEPVPAQRGAVRRGNRAAREQPKANEPLYWGTLQRPGRRRTRRATSTVGTTWQYQVNLLQAEKPADRGASCPTRARPAGRTPG